MRRLIVVSNRVPSPRERGAAPGGLAVALREALAGREALWFGWSGHRADTDAPKPNMVRSGKVSFVTLDLPEAEYVGYYRGFSNGTLWPLLHYRVGLLEFRREDLHAYYAVNERFAEALVPLLQPDDTIWVHDYHLIPLGAALRRRGVTCRIGFFLHVPFPPAEVFRALPRSADLLGAFTAYDLVGLQVENDVHNLSDALAIGGLKARVAPFPIGIDAEGFAAIARTAQDVRETQRLRESMGARALVLGVDRLDYSKGLPNRFHGYARLLARFPQYRRAVTMLQIAPVSRGDVAQFRALRRELDELAGRINGDYAEFDWMPLRYITRTVPRTAIAGFYRVARVGLVTPLRDGMNLVAKEYVAAQNPADPGVLVLSRFAGAAVELRDALLVNPLDPDEIAEALDRALSMPLSERRERWEAMWRAVRANTAAHWARSFLAALEGDRTVGRLRTG